MHLNVRFAFIFKESDYQSKYISIYIIHLKSNDQDRKYCSLLQCGLLFFGML